MLKIRKYLPLMPEPLEDVRCVHAALYDLKGDFLAVLLIVAQGKVDGAHTAAADLPHNPVDSQPLPDEHLRIEQAGSLGLDRSLDQLSAVLVGGMQ